ncbi:hypothetical protein Busp01_03240 [Trinickia caryophylli]|nr:hypothetical protein Busp01_03240 [Trinickia caryophylli]
MTLRRTRDAQRTLHIGRAKRGKRIHRVVVHHMHARGEMHDASSLERRGPRFVDAFEIGSIENPLVDAGRARAGAAHEPRYGMAALEQRAAKGIADETVRPRHHHAAHISFHPNRL